jgi:hypothetical protein
MLPSGGVDEGTNDVALVIDSLSIGGRRPRNIEHGKHEPGAFDCGDKRAGEQNRQRNPYNYPHILSFSTFPGLRNYPEVVAASL